VEKNEPATVLPDTEWVDAVAEEMRKLDPQLQPELAVDAARELAGRERWRAMAPAEVAVKAFG